MKNNSKGNNGNSKNSNSGHHTNRFLPTSLKFISSCIKTASSGVRSASASVAASISGDSHELKDQVLWASFDRVELGSSSLKHVLLLGYTTGFQVIDVEDASNVIEIVSRRDDPVTFLQIQPLPAKSESCEGFLASHPLLLVVASDESKNPGLLKNAREGTTRDGTPDSQMENLSLSPTIVRFYSLRSHNYVHVLRFRSPVYMVRCSVLIVAVGLATQIYCFDALTLENKFSVLTYPVPQLSGLGVGGMSIGLGPMAVGSRWLSYASDNPLVSNMGRLSPQNLTPMSVSPSTSPGGGSFMARYAVESSKQLAAGLLNLGDMGYKTLSKYYQDLIPDGSSSPVASNHNWRVGRAIMHQSEPDNAGLVIVKDVVSKAVVSQFRAHTSPISALCFDPSGTLLVTASIHGHNINIFRIMPLKNQAGLGSGNYDWSSSHVHLYKLHRGITTAVIQDICFSHFSQWIAIVTSRGTCHIFVLSPFGGDNVLQVHSSHIDGPTVAPIVSLPWWSTPSFMVNQNSYSTSPPSPVTLSVVSRIRSNNSGWLTSVSNVASSAAGKVSIPSGAIAAVFHSCVPMDHLRKTNTLDHLLVYTPCGHIVQYKLLSSAGGQPSEAGLRASNASVQMPDDELRVKVESVQWWDVCRRVDWPEREECISGLTRSCSDIKQQALESPNSVDARLLDSMKPHDQSHLYISNAEVQMSFWRIPLWQRPKISFYAISSGEQNFSENNGSGEIEVEKIPVYEIEIRRKDLLPVFDHFSWASTTSDRNGCSERCSPLSTASPGGKESLADSLSTSSIERPYNDSSENTHFPSLLETPYVQNEGLVSTFSLPPLCQTFVSQNAEPILLTKSQIGNLPALDSNSLSTNTVTLSSCVLSGGRAITKEVQTLSSGVTSEASTTSSNRSDLSMNIIDEGPLNDSSDFEQFFQEDYCNVSVSKDCKIATTNNTPAEEMREDADSDDTLGGVFAFSEEG